MPLYIFKQGLKHNSECYMKLLATLDKPWLKRVAPVTNMSGSSLQLLEIPSKNIRSG